MTKVLNKIVGIVANISLLVGTLGALATPAPAYASTAWNVGDLFVGVGGGAYHVYDNGGVFKEAISDGLGGFTTGCAFNGALDKLYTTNFDNTKVVVYNDASPHTIAQTVDTGAINPGGDSESVVFAANGDFYVGHPDGDKDVQRYDAAGVYQQSYDFPIEARGTDWIDLAADQTTMFYTSEGRLVKKYDVSGAGAALPDFALLPGAGVAFALRLLPPGDGSGGLLVADNLEVKKLDGTGAVVATYDVTGEDTWFSLNLDPDGTSFWAGNYGTGKFYKFDIATPGVDTDLLAVDTGVGSFNLFGICLKGELTAAQAQITLDPPTAENNVGQDHTVTATISAGGLPVEDELVSFQVVSGPNAGEISDPNTGECTANDDCTSDVNGQVSWTYTGTGGVGTDLVEACFTDAQDNQQCATAEKNWVAIEVAVDVKPQSCRNPLNVKAKGVLPTAIVGTSGFDVTQVDVSTVKLEGVSPLRSALEDVATPFEPFVGKEDAFDCTTEGADGFLDLTLKFDVQAVVAALGPVTDGDVLVLHLTGNMLDGTLLVGEDVVVILKK